MKSIFASLILALFAVSVAGKEQHCIFRVLAEANPNDTPVFSSSVRISAACARWRPVFRKIMPERSWKRRGYRLGSLPHGREIYNVALYPRRKRRKVPESDSRKWIS